MDDAFVTTMVVCDLCGAEMKGGTRTCGAELCDPCYSGSLVERLRPAGLVLDVDWKRSSSHEPEGGREHSIRKAVSGEVQIRRDGPVATFSREGAGVKLRKFFGLGPDELQLGDATFDDAVLVDTSTPELTRTVLEDEGLRSVVMEAVSTFDGMAFDSLEGRARVSLLSVEGAGRWRAPREGQQRLVAIALVYLRRRFG